MTNDAACSTAFRSAANFLQGHVKPTSTVVDKSLIDKRVHDWRSARAAAVTACSNRGPQSSVATHTDAAFEAHWLLWFNKRWRYGQSAAASHVDSFALSVRLLGDAAHDCKATCIDDARLRPLVLDSRSSSAANHNGTAAGCYPQVGSHVKLHLLCADEAVLWHTHALQPAATVVSVSAADGSAVVRAAHLLCDELLELPLCRMELISDAEYKSAVSSAHAVRRQMLHHTQLALASIEPVLIARCAVQLAQEQVLMTLRATTSAVTTSVLLVASSIQLECELKHSTAVKLLHQPPAATDDTLKALVSLSCAQAQQLCNALAAQLYVHAGKLQLAQPAYDGAIVEKAVHAGFVFTQTAQLCGVSVTAEITTAQADTTATAAVIPVSTGLTLSFTVTDSPHLVYTFTLQPSDWQCLQFPELKRLTVALLQQLCSSITACMVAADGYPALLLGKTLLRPAQYCSANASTCSSALHSSGSSNTNSNSNSCSSSSSNSSSMPKVQACTTAVCICTLRKRTAVRIAPGHHCWLTDVHCAAHSDCIELRLLNPLWKSLTLRTTASTRHLLSSSSSSSSSTTVQQPTKQRRNISLRVTHQCEPWITTGFGPVRWMNHSQRELLCELVCTWLTQSDVSDDVAPRLCSQPVLAQLQRSERTVTVLDKGEHLTVQVASATSSSSCDGTTVLLQRDVHECDWNDATGLRGLRWMPRSSRQYLAWYIAQRTRIADQQQLQQLTLDSCTSSSDRAEVITIDTEPVLLWQGTLRVPRLQQLHTDSVDTVHVTVHDAGAHIKLAAYEHPVDSTTAATPAAAAVTTTTAVASPVASAAVDVQHCCTLLTEQLIPLAQWRAAVRGFSTAAHMQSLQPAVVQQWLEPHVAMLLLRGAPSRSQQYAQKRLADALNFGVQSATHTPTPYGTLPPAAALKSYQLVSATAVATAAADSMLRKRADAASVTEQLRAALVANMIAKHKADKAAAAAAVLLRSASAAGVLSEQLTAASSSTGKVRLCLCCGKAAGVGHGAKCTHTNRCCRPCTVRALHQRRRGSKSSAVLAITAAASTANNENTVVNRGARPEQDSSDSEYEWVTDDEATDDEQHSECGNAYECNACGAGISSSDERWHCSDCADYDLCGQCHNTDAGLSSSSIGSSQHTAEHAVQRIVPEVQ
jgi:Zinc finger, ZZ type